MCGIAGIISREAGDLQQRSVHLASMLRAIGHRGPDGGGTWNDPIGHASLSHCRLAIIDLSPQGRQPMCIAGARMVIVFNGEIYNYVELRKELENEGVNFRGQSDTEVLLNGLCHWGMHGALNRLVGMFAFALWDQEQRTLYLARDRVGKKPLYYYSDGKVLYFASEIKAFTRVKNLDLRRCPQAVYHYLSLGFVPPPSTIYVGLFEVKPGHYLRVDSQLRLTDSEYWSFQPTARRQLSTIEAVEEAEYRLVNAIKLRLRSDVPIGVFLSGGIDSGLITAIAAQNSSRAIQTFTVRFDSKDFDESPLARRVAVRYGTDHHELRLTCNPADLLETMVKVYDQPFADPSALPTLAVARETSRYVKVVLNGEGGDELFGGYRRHQAAKYFGLIKQMGGAVAVKLLHAAGNVAPHPIGFRTRYSFFYRFMHGVDADPFRRYLIWGTDGFSDAEKRSLLRDAGTGIQSTETYLSESFRWLNGAEPLEHFMALDLLSGMSGCLLVKMDRATMAYGLEARSPFLDHHLIEWAGDIDRASLLPGALSKPILRAMASRYLPGSVTSAPKRGFDVPLIDWTKQSLWAMAMDLCLSGAGLSSEIFDRKRLRAILERRIPLDTERWTKQVWLLLMLALWERHERLRCLN